MSDILLFSSSQQFDIFALTETWLSENHFNSEMFDNQLFNVYRNDRCYHTTGLTRGGGVLIAVRSSVLSMQIELPSSSNSSINIDQLIIRLDVDNFHVVFLIISYIPPKSSFDVYKTHIDNCLSILNNLKENQHIIILGDFNLPFLNWVFDNDDKCLIPYNVSSDCESVVVDTLAEFGLKQINCFQNHLNRYLDLVFTDNELGVCIDSPTPPPLPNTDNHVVLCMSFEFFDYIKQASDIGHILNYDKCNFNNVSNFLNRVNWFSIFDNIDIEETFTILTNLINEAIDLNTPKTQKKSQSKPCWFNKKLINLNNRKNKAFKLYRDSRDNNALYMNYLRINREFNFLNKFLYKNYVLSMKSKLKKDSKSFWKFINKKSSTGIPNSVRYMGQTSSDLSNICNFFADFFRTVFKPTCQQTRPLFMCSSDSFNVSQLYVEKNDILNELLKLKDEKQSGFDGIAPIIIKNCALSLTTPLEIIFNRSLHEGYFLKQWKSSYVYPIFKSGSKNEVIIVLSVS